MNGAHDMGGMHGFGPVEDEPVHPIFHGDWEKKAFALTLACGGLGQWSIDEARYARERQPPAFTTNKTGPELNGVIGRVMGSIDGFKYSKGFQQAHDEGRVWDEAAMAEFMANPKAFMKGTRMSFVGLKKDEDVAALIAYLSTIPE